MIGIATDNLPNRNGGRFSLEELYKISALLAGVPVSTDHDMHYSSKVGTVIRSWVEVGEQNQDIGEPYGAVWFEAEIPGVSAQVGDGVSITVSYQYDRCPDCDCGKTIAECPRDMFINVKWHDRVGVQDVYELSLVLVPAVKGAKIVRDSIDGNGMQQISQDVVNEEPGVVLTLTPEEVSALAAEKAGLAASLAAAESEASRLRQELAAAQQTAIKAQLGLAMPGINTHLAVHRDRPGGAIAELQSILDASPQRTAFYGGGTRLLVQRDEVAALGYWLENRAAIVKEVEVLARDHGLLRGTLSRDAATTAADIPDMFLVHLSMMLRVTHQTGRVFWQFPRLVDDFTKVPGDTIAVPRWSNLAAPAAEIDFTLTPGTALSATPQNLSQTSRSIVLEEKGLGKAGVAGSEPIGVPEFISSRSILDLQRVVMERLGLHYEACWDLMIRARYQTSTAIRYNDNGVVTSTPANVNVGDDGTLTEDLLHDLFSEMSAAQIPTYDDGYYVGVLNPKAASQIRKSVGDRWRSLTTIELIAVFPTVAMSGNVSGYIGTACGFHLYQTNVYGVGVSGEGVNTVTLGVGSRLTRSSWFFGKDAVGLGVGMPVTIRANDDTSFGRLQQYIWLSHVGCATLDVDPNNDPSEQLRVFQLRTIDSPI